MKTKFSILLGILIFTASCGDLKTTSYFSQPGDKLAQYSAIEVNDFESKSEKFPKEALVKIPDRITDELRSSKLFSTATRGTAEDIPASQTIVLLGEVSEFQTAGDVEYEGGALKFGEVSISISVAMVEKATGNEIASGEINSFSSMGFLGGDIFGEKLYEQVADEVLEFVRNNKK